MTKEVLISQVSGWGTPRKVWLWVRSGRIKARRAGKLWLVTVNADNTPVFNEVLPVVKKVKEVVDGE